MSTETKISDKKYQLKHKVTGEIAMVYMEGKNGNLYLTNTLSDGTDVIVKIDKKNWTKI